jgi:hypothetical protein
MKSIWQNIKSSLKYSKNPSESNHHRSGVKLPTIIERNAYHQI